MLGTVTIREDDIGTGNASLSAAYSSLRYDRLILRTA